ncbi:hypothetical protein L207DRAFT_482070 [Hyaloscypha variabilis F]|uniref:Zn(2)-C6 fungal-type domain-containing protein n=1 Tax=Hyaloscypha variabilis (strain UAMH 11265 / GT02V1 / F) TaxID=1149755 RepID=A0A2J6S4E1_HYAVF|nr:hypothetical protein L207DRAFT_482070 [Hyaloscypha variabilis F]
MTDRVRRNGLPSSCEPCRRSKVRCDHARPHCNRCVRRKFSRNCYYQPSPMTRGANHYTEPLLTPQSIDTATMSPVCALAPLAENTPADEYDRGTGLVTMHNSLMPFADSDDKQPHRKFSYLTRSGLFIPKRVYPMTPAAIAEGVEILRSLIEFNADLPEFVRDRFEDDADELCGSPLFKAAWRATQTTLRQLGTRPPLDQLTSTALAIFEQTSCPLELPLSAENDALEFALSGDRLRWEAIGMCFIRIGLLSATLGTNGQVFHGRGQLLLDRQKTMLMAFDACMQTRAFCNQAEQTNDLTLWLLTSVYTLATWCFGDDSSRVWYLMGDLSSAIVALGFHKGFKYGESGPPYLVELRKRVIALAHERDKELATFVGRPPHLSRRYCTVDLPLDVPDSAIIGPVEHFEAARARLDENGWSGDVMVHPAARLRAILLLSIIREEVLELSLGPPIPNIAQQARQILSNLTSTWESIPHKQYEQSMGDTMLPGSIWVVLSPQLECLYSEFLLHKLLISQNEGSRDAMIRTSHEMLQLTLSLLKKTDVIATPNLEAMMAFYTMPCASVLILELFRQNRQPHQSAALNRSTLVQDISVLISCCESLAVAGQSNYQICKQAQTVFSRCLDQILNQTVFPSPGLMSTPGGLEVQEPFSLGLTDFGLTELYPQDPEWSTWLESFDLYGT